MLKAYFVSDLHLTTPSDWRGQCFWDWLKTLNSKSCSHLFLVGDIFDLWIADHRFFDRTFSPIIDEFKRLKKEGVALHYFEGNHDLYLDSFFGDELGMVVHRGPANFKIGTRRVRVEHGDQMDPSDKGYIFLRWFLRTKPMELIAKNLPESLVIQIGKSMSTTSRKYTSEIKTMTRDNCIRMMRKYAEKVAQADEFDCLIHGHTHERDDYEFEIQGRQLRSVNLGSWMSPPIQAFLITDTECSFVTIDSALARAPKKNS